MNIEHEDQELDQPEGCGSRRTRCSGRPPNEAWTALASFHVDPRFVGTAADLVTSVVFCALDPPEDPLLLLYCCRSPPDLTLTQDDVAGEDVCDVPVF